MMAAKFEPQPLEALEASRILGIFTDVDDTLTHEGQLRPTTYAAMQALRATGRKIIPVTGRSSGWGHMMMSQWPVDAVIAESGGTIFLRDKRGRISMQLYSQDVQLAKLHEQKRQELMALCASLVSQFAGLRFALDNRFRVADVAIDYNESVDRVADEIVNGVIETIQQAGFNAKASSIHINAWWGEFDKAPTSLQYLQSLAAPLSDLGRWVFIGDAPNDASMFAAFHNSVAVANIKSYWQSPALTSKPRYICTESYGAGFEELARHLCQTD